MKIKSIKINSVFPVQQDITSCHDSGIRLVITGYDLTTLIVFDSPKNTIVTLRITIPAGVQDWDAYIREVLTNIEQ